MVATVSVSCLLKHFVSTIDISERSSTNLKLVNRDDFISRWRNTNYSRDEISSRVVG